MSELHRQFGQLLKVERERRKFNLLDISTELKITEDNLIAIEEGDLTGLPSDLYYRLFAKSYSEYLGIDFTRTIDAMKQDIVDLHDETTGDPDTAIAGKKVDDKSDNGENSEDKNFVKLALILSSITVVIFAIFLLTYNFFWSDPETDLNNNAADKTGTNLLTNNQQAAADNSFKDYNWSYPNYESPDSLVLTFTPREPSWVAVFADGDTAIYQTLKPGSVYRRSAKYRFIVSVGVPRVVDIKLNGRPIELAPKPGARITKVEINQTNYHKLLNQNLGQTDPNASSDGS